MPELQVLGHLDSVKIPRPRPLAKSPSAVWLRFDENRVGAMQARISGVAQYHFPRMFHLTGITGEQGTTVGKSCRIQVNGSAKRTFPSTMTGTSCVQLLYSARVAVVAAHLMT